MEALRMCATTSSGLQKEMAGAIAGSGTGTGSDAVHLSTSFGSLAVASSSAANILRSDPKYSKLDDYVWKEEDRPRVPHNAFCEESELPCFDLSVFRSGGIAGDGGREAALRRLVEATKEWGFFQVSNHGVDVSFIEKVEGLGRRLFALPSDRKLAALCKPLTSDGYSCGALGSPLMGAQDQDKRVQNISWMESFHFPQTPELIQSWTDLLFPGGDEEVRSGVQSYFTVMESLGREVLELLLEGLGCTPHALTQTHGKRSELRLGLKLNLYPPYPSPDLTMGLVPHADPGLITILHQDQVGGLQISKNGQWNAVRPKPGCLILNVGDSMQVYSNDVYKSVWHRAVVNSSQERFSMALFIRSPMDAVLAPLPELLLQGQRPAYRSFTYAEFRKANLEKPFGTVDNLAPFRVPYT